ncbi:MAG: Gfo/Idh/MocA family oxidoreductase [Bacteroidaceae bacterium]|nr:Gfo/Idh/MocA family oxidoreductase [Bacteroidaceae bacterium]
MHNGKVGIIGTGWIADMMARTLTGIDPKMKYAVASRTLEKAQQFAAQWGFEKAYGSYRELVEDPEVELVYVATPHSHHYDNSVMAIEAGKPVLCEKAFTANARQADALLNLAHKKGVFITEAIWTRYMPLSAQIRQVMESGIIGQPRLLNASLCYMMEFKERILRPDLCGGALLDLGVYSINFARMYFGKDVVARSTSCVKGTTGMDMYNAISWTYRDGRVANIQSSTMGLCGRIGQICGTEGYIIVDNINCPQKFTVFKDYESIAVYDKPAGQITGYEYQVLASFDAIDRGLMESPYMPHQETLDIMKLMDSLRKEWGVVYPMD